MGDASPSTEDASPVPSSQVQSNPVGLTGAYFRGPASPPSSARPRARPHLRPHDRPSTSTRKSTCSSTRRLTWMSTWLHPRCAVSKIRGFRSFPASALFPSMSEAQEHPRAPVPALQTRTTLGGGIRRSERLRAPMGPISGGVGNLGDGVPEEIAGDKKKFTPAVITAKF